jgi:hypothetical protein
VLTLPRPAKTDGGGCHLATAAAVTTVVSAPPAAEPDLLAAPADGQPTPLRRWTGGPRRLLDIAADAALAAGEAAAQSTRHAPDASMCIVRRHRRTSLLPLSPGIFATAARCPVGRIGPAGATR